MNQLFYNNGSKELEFSFNSPFWINSIEGLSENDIDISSSQGVSQIGATVTATSIQPKSITINGTIMGATPAYRKNLLNIVLPGVPAKLYYNDYYIDCIPSKTPVIANTLNTQEFQIVLFCAYPFWRNVETQEIAFTQRIALFEFPFTTGTPFKLSDFEQSIFKTVTNDGDSESGLIVTFKAITDVTNPKLMNLNNRSFLKLNYKLLAGEKVIINTNAGFKDVSIDRSGITTNAFKYLTVDSNMGLTASGGDTLFQILADVNVEGLEATIELSKGVYTGV